MGNPRGGQEKACQPWSYIGFRPCSGVDVGSVCPVIHAMKFNPHCEVVKGYLEVGPSGGD